MPRQTDTSADGKILVAAAMTTADTTKLAKMLAEDPPPDVVLVQDKLQQKMFWFYMAIHYAQ